MSSIYFHIPYCKKKCNYCSFFVNTHYKNIDIFVNYLIKELELRKNYLHTKELSTIYFGGGTPSLLKPAHIEGILDKLKTLFILSKTAEISLEGNPEDLSLDYLKQIKNAGINRLSIGVQSFYEEDLIFFSRRHNSADAEKCIDNTIKTGFNNISIDLMYGFSGLSSSKWKTNLHKALSKPIHHISAYHLSIDPGTKLHQRLLAKDIKEIDEKQSWTQFNLLIDLAEKYEFKQYELSNFCKNGYISQHNSSYWSSNNYLGIGPSAHSFNGVSRQWNVYNVNKYIQTIGKSEIPSSVEKITDTKRYNTYVMIKLRTSEGIKLSKIKQFGKIYYQHTLKQIDKYLTSKHLCILDFNTINLSRKGMFISNTIIKDFFLT